MVVHSVYLWLHDNVTEEDRREFRNGLKLLTTAQSVVHGYVGVPADIARDVIDSSYSFSLILIFEDLGAHNRFQDDSKHHCFREMFRSYWKRVQIYDVVEVDE